MTAYVPPTNVSSGTASSAQYNQEALANIRHLKERVHGAFITSGSVNENDVLVVDASTGLASQTAIGVHTGIKVVADHAAGSGVAVYTQDYGVHLVNVTGAVARFDYLVTSSALGYAASNGSTSTGAFAIALGTTGGGGGTILARLLPFEPGGTGGGGSVDYAEVGDLAEVSWFADAGSSGEVPRADHVHAIAAGVVNDSHVHIANKDGNTGTPSMRTLGAGALQSAPGNHTHGGGSIDFGEVGDIADIAVANAAGTSGEVADAGHAHKIPALHITDGMVAAANKDGASGTASLRTLGTGAAQAAAGNHAHSLDFGESGDIQPTGAAAAAGATGEVADAGHVHLLGAHSHNGSTPGGDLTSPNLITDVRSASGTNVLLQVINSKGLAIGSAANATGATDPFFYITTSAGPPTGTPTAATGRVPIHYDTTNNRLYLYNGAWRYLMPGTVPQVKIYPTSEQTFSDGIMTDVDPLTGEAEDTDTMHFADSSAITGTVTKTNAQDELVGAGTSFLSQLSVGQVISVPGGAIENRTVRAITDNTHLFVYGNYSNSASAQTCTRKNNYWVARTAGTYLTISQMFWRGDADSGNRFMRIMVNDADVTSTTLQSTRPDDTPLTYTFPYPLNQWDRVSYQARQVSGGSLNCYSNATNTWFWARWIGP